MDLTQRAVADADAKFDSMLRFGAGLDDNCTAFILRRCQLDYAAVTSTVPECRAMAQDYKKNNPDGANHQLPPEDYFKCSQRLRTKHCYDRVFGESDLWKLLFDEVMEAWQRTSLVDAMLEEMLGVSTDHEGRITVAN
ncbi:hypothetical protein HU200_057074 [Digitaria exilis]|uniref:Uncharacterized protein n=1 Tax=Digitaria exilis TaxID=1010633 RepID=A0A835AG20_9POAL|nr:hypothetical protein HU200_057074 [Digitaria exilis]